MSKEYKLEFNDNYIVVEEPYEKDKGIVVLSKTDDCSLHILYESYNPTHIDFFIKLIKYVADLETKIAEEKECSLKASAKHNLEMQNAQICVKELEAKLAESEKELNRYAELFGMKDKDFYVVEKTEYEKMKQGAKDIVMQLKQQLAEKEQEINDICQNYDFQINDFSREVYRLQKREKILEQQLAEKEERIEIARNVKQARIDSLELDKKICEEHKQVIFNQLLEKCKEAEQDKISFCIDKLEKVRNNIKKVPITDYEPNEHFEKMYKSDAIRQIDNQIKLLKEGKL